jgi:surfactin synthase thioesterase subunit
MTGARARTGPTARVDADRTTTWEPAPEDVVWDLRRDARPASPCLLVLPHAGGSAHGYLRWAPLLAPDVGLLIGQYPGRGARYKEPLPSTMDELVHPILRHLPADCTELYVLGHSMGAMVAFEVVRQMEAAGRQVRGLIASSCRAPHLTDPDGTHPRRMTDDELVALLRQRGGTPEEILGHPDMRTMVLRTVRADFAIHCEFRWTGPPRPLRCPVTAVGGDRDPEVPAGALAAWTELSGAGGSAHALPGGHFYFEPDPSGLMAVIADAVRTAAPRPDASEGDPR